jgi:hypothetical protein
MVRDALVTRLDDLCTVRRQGVLPLDVKAISSVNSAMHCSVSFFYVQCA